MNTETLASEMLAEIKKTSKRWFILFLTVLGLWFATIGAFLWYLNTPTTDTTTTTIDQQADNASSNQIIGGDYGSTTDGNGN